MPQDPRMMQMALAGLRNAVPPTQLGLPSPMPGKLSQATVPPPPGASPFSMSADDVQGMGGLAALAAARGRPGGGFGVAGSTPAAQPQQPDQGFSDKVDDSGQVWRYDPRTRNYKKLAR
jgi:hypothetical protein